MNILKKGVLIMCERTQITEEQLDNVFVEGAKLLIAKKISIAIIHTNIFTQNRS